MCSTIIKEIKKIDNIKISEARLFSDKTEIKKKSAIYGESILIIIINTRRALTNPQNCKHFC